MAKKLLEYQLFVNEDELLKYYVIGMDEYYWDLFSVPTTVLSRKSRSYQDMELSYRRTGSTYYTYLPKKIRNHCIALTRF